MPRTTSAPRSIASLALLALLGAASATAQQLERSQAFLQQQTNVNFRRDQQRREIAPVDSLLDWQWGGWIDYYVFHFDDGIQSQRLYQRPGFWLWTHLRLDDNKHEIFARVRLTYDHFQPGDQYDRQADWVGPNFDRAWYRVDVGRALGLFKADDPLQLATRIGRQEVQFGTGYVLDLPLDAVTIEGQIYDWRLVGLIGHTIDSYPDIDPAEPVDSFMDRWFYGGQVSYEGFDDHQLFAYALWQQDHGDERPEVWLQEFDYESQYYGFGARGSITPNLLYWAEAAYETGRSYGAGRYLGQNEIDAWGWDAGIQYLFDHPTKPQLWLEYMFASGDGDRRLHPTSALGGNAYDDEDTSFVAFGFRDTGIALSPLNSNLHIFKAGGSIRPLPEEPLTHNLEVGTNWFLYHKHHEAGAISDVTATRADGYVGWEMDYFVNWRFASDLSWTIQYGMFFPGDAYYDRDMRHFLFTGVTWSF